MTLVLCPSHKGVGCCRLSRTPEGVADAVTDSAHPFSLSQHELTWGRSRLTVRRRSCGKSWSESARTLRWRLGAEDGGRETKGAHGVSLWRWPLSATFPRRYLCICFPGNITVSAQLGKSLLLG